MHSEDWWRNTDPATLASAFHAITGRPLNGRGRTWVSMCCPLPGHDEHNPSFSFNTETGAWRCHGCARTGDIVTLTMECCGASYQEAFYILKNMNP